MALRLQHSLLEIEENNLLLIAVGYRFMQLKKGSNKKRKHRWWVHNIIRNRIQQGTYYNLVKELQLDGEKYQQYFRLTREQFAQVLFYVEKDLVKYCRSREVICPRQRLAICLR